MKLKEIKTNINIVYYVDNEIIIKNNNEIRMLNFENSISLIECDSSYLNDYIYVRYKNYIEIFSSKLNKLNTFPLNNLDGVKTIFDENNFVLVTESKEVISISFIKQNEIFSIQPYFYGKIINQNYRLNYPDSTFNNPRYFRCSNLLDTETYWDYDCGEGKEAGKFYVWNDNLVFTKGNHEGTNLVVIELITGRVLWEIPILYGAFSFDSERGLLVSFWCSKLSGNNYQIIDLQHKSIENGTPDFSVLLENVALNWQMQYLYENKLYFVDNVYSIHGEPSRAPRFGRFDIKTKRIDFLQEVPEASGCQFEQVFYHDSKLYLRSSANQLFIFED